MLPSKPSPTGAYGFTITGPLAGHRALRQIRDSKGSVSIGDAGSDDPMPASRLQAGHVSLQLADGAYLDVRRTTATHIEARLFGGPERTLDDLVHPYLAPVAALAHRWRGTPAVHGAALSIAGA